MAGMTRYSVDSGARVNAVLSCAVVSLIVSWLANHFLLPNAEIWAMANGLGPAVDCLEKNGVLGQLAPFALFGLFWVFFDKFVWKWKWLTKIHGIPDLNGQWQGTALSSFKDKSGNPYEYSMSLKVTQSFTQMSCVSKFKHSESVGNMIGLVGCGNDNGRYSLGFSYGNTADESSIKVDSWQEKHEGFNVIVCEGNHMHGHYFTNREPATKGKFHLDRKE